MAAPYSMDLRARVFKAWEASGDAEEVAATFGVSRANAEYGDVGTGRRWPLSRNGPTVDGGHMECPSDSYA